MWIVAVVSFLEFTVSTIYQHDMLVCCCCPIFELFWFHPFHLMDSFSCIARFLCCLHLHFLILVNWLCHLVLCWLLSLYCPVVVMVVVVLPLGLHIFVPVAFPIVLLFHQLQLLLEQGCVDISLCSGQLVLLLHLQFQLPLMSLHQFYLHWWLLWIVI